MVLGHLAVLVEQGILAFIPYILFQLTLMFLLFRDYLRGLLSRGRIYFDHTAAIMILVTLSFLAGFVNLMYGRVLSRFLLFGALGTYFAIRVIQRNNTSGAERELI